MDILKYGADVTLVSPQSLIDEVLLQANAIIKNY